MKGELTALIEKPQREAFGPIVRKFLVQMDREKQSGKLKIVWKKQLA